MSRKPVGVGHCPARDLETSETFETVVIDPEVTLGGYMRKHDRAAAFSGRDGEPYSVAIWVDDEPDARERAHEDRGRANYHGTWDGMSGVRFGNEGYRGGLRATALLTIERIDERFSLARVVKACDQVEIGDYLAPVTIPDLPTPTATGAHDYDDRAMVLFGRDLRQTFGDGDILSINRGSSHGVTPGMRFALYHSVVLGVMLVMTVAFLPGGIAAAGIGVLRCLKQIGRSGCHRSAR